LKIFASANGNLDATISYEVISWRNDWVH
jgi:hypothetical protein